MLHMRLQFQFNDNKTIQLWQRRRSSGGIYQKQMEERKKCKRKTADNNNYTNHETFHLLGRGNPQTKI